MELVRDRGYGPRTVAGLGFRGQDGGQRAAAAGGRPAHPVSRARPGPRLEASLRIAAAAIDPESCANLAPPEGHGWQTWPVKP